jgi:hypothetical protein
VGVVTEHVVWVPPSNPTHENPDAPQFFQAALPPAVSENPATPATAVQFDTVAALVASTATP